MRRGRRPPPCPGRMRGPPSPGTASQLKRWTGTGTFKETRGGQRRGTSFSGWAPTLRRKGRRRRASPSFPLPQQRREQTRVRPRGASAPARPGRRLLPSTWRAPASPARRTASAPAQPAGRRPWEQARCGAGPRAANGGGGGRGLPEAQLGLRAGPGRPRGPWGAARAAGVGPAAVARLRPRCRPGSRGWEERLALRWVRAAVAPLLPGAGGRALPPARQALSSGACLRRSRRSGASPPSAPAVRPLRPQVREAASARGRTAEREAPAPGGGCEQSEAKPFVPPCWRREEFFFLNRLMPLSTLGVPVFTSA